MSKRLAESVNILKNARARTTSKSSPSIKERKFTVIGFFNFKGGVGKTTIVINLAVSICRTQKKRVLIVDADPQCSTTLFFFPQEQAYYRTESVSTPVPPNNTENEEVENNSSSEESDVETAVAPYARTDLQYLEKLATVKEVYNEKRRPDPASVTPEPNLYSALRSILSGNPTIDVREIAKQCPRLLQDRVGDNLILLRGNSRINGYQSLFSNAKTWDNPAMRNNLGAFRAIVHALAAELEVDIVLVDFGPSTDTFNETCVMSCDYILPPCFADSFSNSSIQSFLTSLLFDWKDQLNSNIRNQDRYSHKYSDIPVDCPVHPESPTLLSAIVSKYKTKDKQVICADARWIREIDETFARARPGLKEKKIKHCYLRDAENRRCCALPLYRDLSSLHAACHDMSLPVTALTVADLKRAKQDYGYNLKSINQDGSTLDTVNDTIRKVGILSSVLLRLPVPK